MEIAWIDKNLSEQQQAIADNVAKICAASLYDAGQPCGAESNAAKLLGGRAAFEACTQAVLAHGGMGYAREYQVERLMRESMITRITPVSEEMVLSFLAENVLDLPKSY